MVTHSLTLILGGVDVLTPEMGDALEQAGCNDATMSSGCGIVSVAFDREAESLGDAVGSAIEQVVKAGYAVARVEVG